MIMAAMQKKEFRQILLEKLLALTKEEIRRRSANVERILSNLSIYQRAKVIMGYYPLRGEVDILGMLGKVLGSKKVCFPVMDLDKKALRVFEVTDLEEGFVKGPFGVMQPDIGKAKEVDVREVEVVLVPGLAFDRERNRLGRGAGFYDRFLKRLNPLAKKVGVAFDFQIVKDLPVHPQLDEKVDLVVSEDGCI